MTIKKSIFLLFIFIFSCVEIGDSKPPKNLIPPEQMSFIMIDVILMKNIIRDQYAIKEKTSLLVSQYLYDKYDIDSTQFASSQTYYSQNPKKYMPIFKTVEEHLKKILDSVQKEQRAVEE